MFYMFIAGACTVISIVSAQDGDRKLAWFAGIGVIVNLVAGLTP